jgi:PTH1 family peptidyl-tRNA hydrolase
MQLQWLRDRFEAALKKRASEVCSSCGGGETKVIAGLGNPGRKYDWTPHNIGFMVVDQLARDSGVKLRLSRRIRSRTGRAEVAGRDVLLMEPQTYMNRSGTAIRSLLGVKGLDAGSLAVVVDDVNIAAGRLRIRAGGRSGGHRGLESIIRELGTTDFVRIRVGVGGGSIRGDLADYVLRPLTGQKREMFLKVVSFAASAVRELTGEGVEDAMNKYNGAVAPGIDIDDGDGDND